MKKGAFLSSLQSLLTWSEITVFPFSILSSTRKGILTLSWTPLRIDMSLFTVDTRNIRFCILRHTCQSFVKRGWKTIYLTNLKRREMKAYDRNETELYMCMRDFRLFLRFCVRYSGDRLRNYNCWFIAKSLWFLAMIHLSSPDFIYLWRHPISSRG